MDRDETPIGGLSKPMHPTKQLFYASVIMDVVAIVISIGISPFFALGILLYILASRAYSYRGIRLKRFPVIGFLTVFIFQGAVIFFCSYHAISPGQTMEISVIPCIISSLMIGALYPLTQVYQHEEDKKDGVTTLSYILGKKGSFVFSGILFLSATILFYLRFQQMETPGLFFIYLGVTLPVVLFFLYWMLKVLKDERNANFKNSLWMNVIATVCMTIFFLILIVKK